MNNLENFNCIYASLSESSYNGRPNAFPKYQNSKEKKNLITLDVIDEKEIELKEVKISQIVELSTPTRQLGKVNQNRKIT